MFQLVRDQVPAIPCGSVTGSEFPYNTQKSHVDTGKKGSWSREKKGTHERFNHHEVFQLKQGREAAKKCVYFLKRREVMRRKGETEREKGTAKTNQNVRGNVRGEKREAVVRTGGRIEKGFDEAGGEGRTVRGEGSRWAIRRGGRTAFFILRRRTRSRSPSPRLPVVLLHVFSVFRPTLLLLLLVLLALLPLVFVLVVLIVGLVLFLFARLIVGAGLVVFVRHFLFVIRILLGFRFAPSTSRGSGWSWFFNFFVHIDWWNAFGLSIPFFSRHFPLFPTPTLSWYRNLKGYREVFLAIFFSKMKAIFPVLFFS